MVNASFEKKLDREISGSSSGDPSVSNGWWYQKEELRTPAHTELYNVSINSIRIGLTVPRWFKRIKVYYVSVLNREKTANGPVNF